MRSISWATSVMALYTPEELANFDAKFNPPPAQPEPIQRAPADAHEAMLRERAARQAKWLAEYVPTDCYAPEAVCRGHSSPGPAAGAYSPIVCTQRPGDSQPASREWVHCNLGHLPGFERIATAQELKDGHLRDAWRAAAAALVQRPASQVRRPAAFLLQALSDIAAGYKEDPRAAANFEAADGWHEELILFSQDLRASRAARSRC